MNVDRRLTRIDALAALALALGYVAVLVATTRDLGYARDEGFYFHAASSYARWFELLFSNPKAAFEPGTVDTFWGVNHEHPGLIKSLFALSNLWLQKKWHLFAMEGTSYRFPAIALAGLGIGLVYLWGAQARSRITGLAAAVLLAAMPRFFYQSHLACFDIPIVTLWAATAYAFWRTLRDGGRLWPLLTGLAFGLALDTKHNAWFLPFLGVGHTIAAQVLFALRRRAAKDDTERTEISSIARAARLRAFTALAAMATLGPLVFYALWPWIWRDTLPRLQAYASFHLHHEYYNMEFLGRSYWTPPMPRAYAWVMTAATVPTITLLLFLTGLFSRARANLIPLLPSKAPATAAADIDPASTDLFWLLALLVNYAAWLSPDTPIFGGTKHWMTAYPFLALFAGVGVDAVSRALGRELRRSPRSERLAARPALPAALVLAAVAAAPIVETAHSHPWGLSSYVPLVGGAPGAATLGLNRTFWGYTTGSVVDYLNREAPKRATVYVHDTAGPSWDMLIADGRLRRDIRGVWSVANADFGLYHHEKHMRGQEFQNWVAFGTARPDYLGGLDGVPVIHVYKRPGKTAGQ